MSKRDSLLEKRAKILRGIRDFFHAQNFIETDTPSLVFSPGMEPHIKPFQITNTNAFLHTSPEFAMKRILAKGYERIFQICKSYRNEPMSSTHHPEFTILEWYRAHEDYFKIMDDTENLFNHLRSVLNQPQFPTPWLRITVEECFQKYAGIPLSEYLNDVDKFAKIVREKKLVQDTTNLSWDDLFFLIMMNEVEPALEKLNAPVIIYNYPASQAALSNIFKDSKGNEWGKRFEVYAGGFELANAFDELTNPVEQKKRFEKDIQIRKNLYGDTYPVSPIDEKFIEALSHMPKAAGIALGVDRLIMYLTETKNISEIVWQEPYV